MSKVVFVGNVPYNMGEEALIDVFKSVGQVVGFRLVFDRDTGKPKGYGFCEFADHETALSAVRNLNNTDVGGRPLRIDLADSDPFLEGKTTVRGEIMDGGAPGPSENRWRGQRDTDNRDRTGSFEGSEILAAIPPGKPLAPGDTAQDAITRAIAEHMSDGQLIEVLAQMKAFVITHPKQAHAFLSAHPQVGYAIFMGLITTNIVSADILQTMLKSSQGRTGSMPPPPPPQNFTQSSQGYGPPPSMHHAQPYPPPGPSRTPVQGVMPPPPAPMYGHPGMPPAPAPTPLPAPMSMPFYRAGMPPSMQPPQAPPMSMQPPQAQAPPPQQAAFLPLLQLLKNGGGDNPDAQTLYSIVLNLTPAQISDLPPAERATIESLASASLLASFG
ncbi:hypothetical protein GGX14DRAFT_605644 [Mycena pura]|uniref:RRM domain-containing protein n=1 Tax=Mycena pura TaxID=153505 RepID=A0AAD6YEE0_9AGAR|nr:hypothetical protein GGX14DRAFT_605644 [Mycena pura]